LGEEVATQIMFSSGTYKIGDKLPPEAELSRTLNGGRSTLREGLKVGNYKIGLNSGAF